MTILANTGTGVDDHVGFDDGSITDDHIIMNGGEIANHHILAYFGIGVNVVEYHLLLLMYSIKYLLKLALALWPGL